MHQEMESTFRNSELYRYKLHNSLYYSSLGRVSMEPSSFRRHHYLASYRSRLSTEWSPSVRATPLPPLVNQTPPIYLTTIGMMPHYGGFIPGGIYRFGQTFGNDTKEVKNWLKMVKPH